MQDNAKNLRLLETTLRQLDVQKHIDVEAIAKGRFKVHNFGSVPHANGYNMEIKHEGVWLIFEVESLLV